MFTFIILHLVVFIGFVHVINCPLTNSLIFLFLVYLLIFEDLNLILSNIFLKVMLFYGKFYKITLIETSFISKKSY